MFLYFKALHIIAVVCWFAGLFYIARLFVYLAETRERPEAEQAILTPQLSLMAKRLWFGITWPSAIATVLFGLSLLHTWWPPPLWLQIKLGLVVLLCAYHGMCHVQYKRLVNGEPAWTPRQYRIWNEAPTLLLVSIVFLVVVKQGLSLVYGAVGLVVFAAALMAGIVVYRRIRERGKAADGDVATDSSASG